MRHLILVLLLATACAPALQYRQDAALAYGFSAPCGQGPFTLSLHLKGARWGEKLAIGGFAPHAVVGRYTIKLDGRRVSEGQFATQHVVQNGTYASLQGDQKPDNQRCVERPAAIAPEPIAPPPQIPVEPPPPWQPPPLAWQPPPPPYAVPTPATPVPPPLPAAPQPVVAAQLVALNPGESLAEGSGNFRLASFTWPSVDLIGTPQIAPDAVLEVTLWSDEPNDWDGATLQWVHEVAEPTVPEAEYIAYLHKARREAEADAKRQQEEANRAYQARQERCNAHHADEDCWGKGGYDAYVASWNAPHPRAQAAVPIVGAAPVVTAPQPRPPEGPPPVAQTEMPPPQPSLHAEWVAGYWQWTGFAWFWLGGWWRVPQQDLVAQATIVAPAPPPLVQVEVAPPPPLPDAVWLAGAWYWDGRIWLWHPGQWTLPPRPGLLWHAPTWVIDGRGVRLVPGVWGEVLRLR